MIGRSDHRGTLLAALIRVGADGRYLDADPSALEVLGVTADELREHSIGDFAGPYADVAREVWRHFAANGAAVPSGDATVHRLDGSTVRVRYTRIAPLSPTEFQLEFEVLGEDAGPPVATNLQPVLDAWRDAERAAGGDGTPAVEALRTLYRHAMHGRLDGPDDRDS